MSFFGRVLHWIANELIVKSLANNKRFQQFALKTDTFIQKNKQNLKKQGEEALKIASMKGEKLIKETVVKPSNIGTVEQSNYFGTVGKFVRAFKEEIQKDLKKKG